MKPHRASDTARVIAAATILLASEKQQPDPVAPGAANLCRLFLSESLGGRVLALSVRWPLTRRFWRWVERMTLPGIIGHYGRRKRWIEARCVEAIAGGYERVVVIGAGFDTLAIRLSREFENLDVVELDHPATQSVKRAALRRDGLMPERNLRFSTIDLTSGPFPELAEGGKSTVFILEGVLMYLSEPAVLRVFDALRSYAGDRTRVIFSFMTRWPDGSSGFRPRSGWIERWLSWCGEPFSWAIEPGAIEDFLSAHGFDLVERVLTRELPAAPADGLDGENLVLCERKKPVTA